MKLKIQQVRQAHSVLHQVADADGLPLPARYRLYQLLRALSGPVSDSDRILEEIASEHVERDDAGEIIYTTDQAGGPAAVIRDPLGLRHAQTAALAIEVDVQAQPLRASELGVALEEINPAALAALGELFDWDGEATAEAAEDPRPRRERRAKR